MAEVDDNIGNVNTNMATDVAPITEGSENQSTKIENISEVDNCGPVKNEMDTECVENTTDMDGTPKQAGVEISANEGGSDRTLTAEVMDCEKADEIKGPEMDDQSNTGQSVVEINKSFKQMSVDPGVRIRMLARIAVSDVHFKHQQLGDPDLCLEEKIEIAQNVLDGNKLNFLSRFGQYLELEDLDYFKNDRNIYEVDFYIKQIMKNKTGSFNRNRIKNRRFEAMKKLVSDGEYFSNAEMKFREPYLFEQMIGQYLTDAEVQSDIDKADLRFSTILIKHMDQLDENARRAVEKDKEEGQEEEEEESDDDDEALPMQSDTNEDAANIDSMEKGTDEEKPDISEAERSELKAEFLTIMQERFLNGDDRSFDYSKVDNNEAYDDLNTLNIDAEEKYFDDEDSASVHSMDSNH